LTTKVSHTKPNQLLGNLEIIQKTKQSFKPINEHHIMQN